MCPWFDLGLAALPRHGCCLTRANLQNYELEQDAVKQRGH